MASNIKGIIVEIGGDTSGLQKALSKVNSSTSSLSRELKGINSLLKLDPKNTELLSQKQTVLKENIKQTSQKLEELKKAQEMADETIANGGKISQENYRNLQREIINTENKLNSLKVEASKWTTAGRSIEEFGSKVTNISNKVDKFGTAITTKLTLPIVALGTYAVKSFNEVDEGADTVIKKTGAIGESAKELEGVYKKVSSNVVGEFNDIGSAVGEINTRFGFTGDVLEQASEKFLKFAKINDTDVNTAVQKVSRYMGDASIESSKYSEVLDQLSSVAQASGISIDSLTEMLTKYGAPMRALGLETKESIAIFAGWEKAGVNTEIAFSGMKKAIGTWGKEGKNSTEEFKKTLEEIKRCPDIASATTKAIEVFGQKAGPDLADAIKGGRFEYSKFLDIVEKSEGTLENTYNGVIDEVDEAQLQIKKLKVQFSEVGQEILKTVVPALSKMLNGVSDLVSSYNKLDDKEKKQIRNMTLFVVGIGPTIKILATLGNGIGKTVEGIGNLSKAIGVMKTNTISGIASVDNLAKVMRTLITPTGLTTIAIGSLIAAYTAHHIAVTKEKASLEGLRDEVSKQKESWKSLGENRQNVLSSTMTEIATYEKLSGELKHITDENGKVKQGYEARAQVILNTLNNALGTEYKMTGNVISQYQTLQTELDKVIAIKKAEAVLNAYQEEYGTAIKEQAKATETLVSLKQKLIETSEKISSGNAKEQKEAQILYSSIAKQIGEQQQLISEYGYTIQNYENLQSASISNSVEEIEKATTQLGISYERAKQTSEESIEKQINNQAKYLSSLKECLANAKRENDSYQASILQTQIDTEEQQLSNLINSLVQQTSTIQELTPAQIEAWKNIAKQSFTEYNKGLSQLPPETRKKIEEATGIIALDTNFETEAGKEGNQGTILFGNNLMLSSEVKKEVSDSAEILEKDTSIENATKDLAQNADSGFNNTVNGIKWGSDLSENIAAGLMVKKSKEKLINAASTVAGWISAYLHHSTPEKGPMKNDDEWMPDMIDNMVKGIKNNKLKVINSAEQLSKDLYDTLNNDIKMPQVQDFGKIQGNLSSKIVDSTKTVFTTPQIVFNVQELDDAKLQQCFDYINNKFGSKY